MRISGTVWLTTRSLMGEDEQKVTRPLNQTRTEENFKDNRVVHSDAFTIGIPFRTHCHLHAGRLTLGTGNLMRICHLLAPAALVLTSLLFAQDTPANDPPARQWHA